MVVLNSGLGTDSKFLVKQINELLPSDIILHPIYRDDGLLLINRYTQLSPFLITQIKTHIKHGMSAIVATSNQQLAEFLSKKQYGDITFIKALQNVINPLIEDFKVPVHIEAFVDARVNLRLIEKNNKVQVDDIELCDKGELVKTFSKSPLWNSFELRLESSRLQERAKCIKQAFLNTVNEDESLLELIKKILNYDGLLFSYSMNTACISLMLGLTLELSDDDLLNLAITALFCNIGFINMDKEELYKFLKNQNDLVSLNLHMKKSLEIVSESRYCRNKSIIYGILDHHEYYNGGGQLSGKKYDEISIFGRILAIAGAYDELVGGYSGGNGLTSTRAEMVIWDNEEGKFDPNIVKIFIYRSNLFKIGQPFAYSLEEKGTIIGFSNYIDAPHRPIVKLINGDVKDYYKLFTF